MTLNELRDLALKIATEKGFEDATIGEDIALIHSEASEALEDHRDGRQPTEIYFEEINPPCSWSNAVPDKPCGIPIEMADIIIRVLHFCGKHHIDIDAAFRIKLAYNKSRPFRHGGKAL